MGTLKHLITEAHRRSLWQVLGIYAVASWVIYEVVVALYEGIGLPSWVPGTALVLLLIGLPIVLATAFVQEGAPLEAGPDAEPLRPGPGETSTAPSAASAPASGEAPEAKRRDGPDSGARSRGTPFTWPRAITGGVLAFAALGLASAGFMGMRALGIGPAATLISSGQLDERAPVLLADFESLTGDEVLSRVVTEAFRADLAQSTAIELANPDDVAHVLERMGREPGAVLDAATAREVATRGGLKAVVAGDIGGIGGRYVLSARIIGSLDGEILVTERATAADSTELVAAIDRLAKSIREEIGESLRSIRRSPYLTAITTPSLPALKKLIQSYEAHNRGDADRALTLLDEAIELDPEFSEAYRKRAAILGNRGRMGEAIADLDRALENPERLTDYERYHARGLRAMWVGDHRAAINEYRALLELDSADSRALNNLGNVYMFLGDWERANEMLGRSLEVVDRGPEGQSVFGGTFAMMALTRWNLDRPDSVQAILDRLRRADPSHPMLHFAEAVLAAAAADYRAAEAYTDSLLQEHPGAAAQLQGRVVLASIRATEGRVAEAVEQLGEAARLSSASGDVVGAMREELSGVLLVATVLADTARTLERLGEIRAEYDLGALTAPPLHRLLTAYAAVGVMDSARTMLRRLREQPEWVHGNAPGKLAAAEATIAMAEGDYETAARSWRTALDAESLCTVCFRVQLGLSEELSGTRDAAIAAYESFFDVRDAWRGLSPTAYPDADPFYRAMALERLGSLHEQAGNRAESARYYRELVNLWENADPALQPRVDAARRALQRLAAEGA